MRFFFDESGDFAVPQNPDIHRVAVAVGLAISDHVWDQIASEFAEFRRRLDSRELAKSEPKGHRLTIEHLREFTALLARHDGVSVTPVTLDLSSLATPGDRNLVSSMREALLLQAERMVYPTAQDQMRTLARQFGNLSQAQMLRVYSWAHCIHQAVSHAIPFLSHGHHRSSWYQVRFEIDPVQAKRRSREEQVFSVMLYAWIAGWSRSHPIPVVTEIHTPDHPFMQNYDTGDGIDLSRLIRDNLHWVSSSGSIGIQMADICSAIVYKAASDLDDRNGSVSLFGSLMRSSFYGYLRGPGLFSPHARPDESYASKYKMLSDVMKRR
jgi:hypothetical protein